MPFFPILFCLALLAVFAPLNVSAAVLQARHDLVVELVPEQSLLRGKDRIDLRLEHACSLDVSLAAEAEVLRLEMDGEPLRYERQAGWLMVDLPSGECSGRKELLLEYAAGFDDPLPQDPVNMDNPGFGVRGVIDAQGAFLMAGSGWHPHVPGNAESFRITVRAPTGMYAVTSGSLEFLGERDGGSATIWSVERVLEALPLCAGAYVVGKTTAHVGGAETKAGGRSAVPVQTFFSAANAGLSERYLEAAARHVSYYSELHGAYAFEKFAVVENFFPTGYGFPSFTLLGGRVLQLPFIPETSLRHEVAHCWWGNGVLVNYADGNWCEGLTAYVSDYLAREEQSPLEARDYRLRSLRDYALLVGEEGGMPLGEFVSRNSPASQAVGYDKAMFVFHMLRREVGDEQFWNGLRRLYSEKVFRKAGWGDIMDVFVAEGALEAGRARVILEQWVEREGAPRLLLEGVEMRRNEPGWRVTGALRQRELPDGSLFSLYVPVVLQCENGPAEELLFLDSEEAVFELSCEGRPLTLQADPGADVFRLLAPTEIPPTVNSLKGADGLTIILAGSGTDARRDIAQRLAMGLSQPYAAIVNETALDSGRIAELAQDEERALLFIGMPEKQAVRSLLPPMPRGVELAGEGVSLPARPEAAGADAVLLLAKDYRSSRSAGLFVSPQGPGEEGDAALAAAARKITHYGSYGLLAFSQGNNLLKLRWPAHSSPLRVDLREGSSAPDPFDDNFFQPHFERKGGGR